MRPDLWAGTELSFVIAWVIGPLATRYHVCWGVFKDSPGTTMAVMDDPDGQLQMVRSTLLDWSADSRMLPNNWAGEPPGTRTMRSKSFTSCLFEEVKPGGSVHAKTRVTGVEDWLHAMLKAEAPDDEENCSDI